MTDTLTGIGSEESGNPAGGNGAEDKGSTPAAAATANGSAEAGNLDWAKAKGWLTAEGALDTAKLSEGYQFLERQVGAMIKVPDEKAKPEDRDAFHTKLGWPGESKGYEFTLPDGLPENFPYDEGMADRFKEWANEARLPKAAAQTLHDRYVKQFAQDIADFDAEVTGKAKSAHEAIVKDWGDPGSEDYIRNRDAAGRALRSDPKLAGAEADLKAAGLLTKDGNFTSPWLANLLAGHGRAMQNDSFTGNGQSAGASANPFDPKTENLTEQGALKKADPSKARALAQAAGWSTEKLQAVFG